MSYDNISDNKVVPASHDLLDSVVQAHGSGELRPQQKDMVTIVAEAIVNQQNAVVQAGTGVGKSLGYLIPACVSGRRIVVSTATKQLSEQLGEQDIPFLEEVVRKERGFGFSHATLKGRANYACLKKIQETKDLEKEQPGGGDTSVNNQEALFPSEVDEKDQKTFSTAEQRGKEVKAIIDWVEKGDTDGDRSHGPTVSDATWKNASSTPAECPGKKACPFGETCFAENARAKARASQIVTTNHALVATELSDSGEGEQWGVIGQRDVVIFDEVHELDNYLSTAWGCQVAGRTVEQAARDARRAIPASETKERDAIEELSKVSQKLTDFLSDEDEDRAIDGEWDEKYLQVFRDIEKATLKMLPYLHKQGDSDTRALLARNMLEKLDEDISMLRDSTGEIVRWIGQGDEREVRALHAAPLRVGPRLMESLEASDSTMIATSATITVGGTFDIPTRNLALDEAAREYVAKDVGTPFDYPKQAILYIPKPSDFPAPVFKDRLEHTEATLDMLVELVKAAGGRTLALSTTTYGARRMAERLRDEVSTPVLSQWDATPGVITQQFAEEENSTLCATMGMWHGLNVPGRSLSAVLIDKIPFPPMNDPLVNARTKDVEDRGGNGFMDISVAHATAMLSQGVGRLIRHTSDRGLVAILDTRLTSKPYGRAIMRSLPPMWRTDDFGVALKSLERILK